MLGPLAVWSSDGDPVTIPRLKVRALLADLLIHEGRPVPADRLIADLWADDLPGNPAGSLQAKVSQLRRALGDAEPGGRDLVESGPGGYRLRADPGSVDAGRFGALLAQASGRPDARSRAALLTEALALWRGPAYSEFTDDEFARGAITRLEEQRLTALEDLAEARLKLGEHTLLVGELSDLVAAYPWRERLRAAQMRALYGSGRQSDALASYEKLRRHLLDELGLDPGPGLVALHQAILRQDPELTPEPAPESSAARPVSNLPSPISTDRAGGLVGRSAATAQARALLDTARLVTLTGPGGVGKTSLAIEAARAAAGAFPDGVWIVELATQQRHSDTSAAVRALAMEVAAVLGIREDAAPGLPDAGARLDVSDRLASALRSKQLLLLLDNCEHVVEPVAHLAEQLLAAAADVRILVTTQEPLGLATEIVVPVPPLDVPEPGTPPGDLRRSPAVQLFVDRAAAASPGFAVTADNADAVGEVCRRLDGIPLALELAAARTRTLDVGELARRLDDRFRLLTSGYRTAPRRQRTLRAVIEWSWELLSPAESVVLRRLAVHVGGCTLDAAENVCADGEVPADEVVDLLARLVDRSLVTVVTDRDARRYRLLESVAAYCLERLDEAHETASVRRRHAEYYVSLAEREEPRLRGPGQHEALRRLDAEAANLRAALDTTVRQEAAPLALRLVNSLAWYWFLRGRHQEARRSLTAALGTAEGDSAAAGRARARAMTWLAGVAFTDYQDDPVARRKAVLAAYDGLDDPAGLAFAQWLLAFTMLGSGDIAVGAELVAGALAGFRQLGDRWGIAAALLTRAEQALVRGDLATVRSDGEQSRALFGQLGDRWGQVHPTHLLGTLAEIDGDYEQAARLHRSALRIAEELELWPSVSTQLASLGRLSLLAGDFAEATGYHERALRVAEDQSYGSGAAFAKTGLALGARRQGRLELAEAYLLELLDWNRRTEYLPGAALVLAELGFTAELRGDVELARTWHAQGLAAARDTGDPRAVALALEGLAGVSALTGEHGHAARLLGRADAARTAVNAPRPPAEHGDVERISGAAQAALGDSTFAAEFARGAEMPVDDLVNGTPPGL